MDMIFQKVGFLLASVLVATMSVMAAVGPAVGTAQTIV
jgi:hypothetical protein